MVFVPWCVDKMQIFWDLRFRKYGHIHYGTCPCKAPWITTFVLINYILKTIDIFSRIKQIKLLPFGSLISQLHCSWVIERDIALQLCRWSTPEIWEYDWVPFLWIMWHSVRKPHFVQMREKMNRGEVLLLK